MSAQEQARALMNRHHHQIKQRQQSMLGRASSEIGIAAETAEHWTSIQGKPSAAAQQSYDRSNSALS
ncbi:MAG: hypothetical protein HC886_02690 [Leptolyngbyaceae cyanobacterium SM1_1_3]|nr:hypothetical protein [Leptolyngbyaceae cyanobacterium SM1_1_3]NJN01712.1 hypothetical protein [Leptolyngbyaceae cyanobacterium RM1_1_2]NJO09373.1 hypothetical protein [Leptolyngbyaceae cyanobacterium SL_1_1]